MTKLEELKAELAARKATKQAEMEELIATTKVRMELTSLDSPIYTERKLLEEDNAKLDVITQEVTEMYARKDRKIGLTFSYGVIPNKIITLLRAIQYSGLDEKQELLMMTGLSEQTVEDVLDAFGNTSFFSKAGVEIVPAIPMQLDDVKELLTQVYVDMQLVSTPDLRKFNVANVKYQYDRAQLKAEEMLANTLEYIDTAVNYEEQPKSFGSLFKTRKTP